MSALHVRTGLAAALAVVFVFGSESAPVRPGSLVGDVNGDGIVDFEDVLLVLQNWT